MNTFLSILVQQVNKQNTGERFSYNTGRIFLINPIVILLSDYPGRRLSDHASALSDLS